MNDRLAMKHIMEMLWMVASELGEMTDRRTIEVLEYASRKVEELSDDC
jgi:hypothetical protein